MKNMNLKKSVLWMIPAASLSLMLAGCGGSSTGGSAPHVNPPSSTSPSFSVTTTSTTLDLPTSTLSSEQVLGTTAADGGATLTFTGKNLDASATYTATFKDEKKSGATIVADSSSSCTMTQSNPTCTVNLSAAAGDTVGSQGIVDLSVKDSQCLLSRRSSTCSDHSFTPNPTTLSFAIDSHGTKPTPPGPTPPGPTPPSPTPLTPGKGTYQVALEGYGTVNLEIDSPSNSPSPIQSVQFVSGMSPDQLKTAGVINWPYSYTLSSSVTTLSFGRYQYTLNYTGAQKKPTLTQLKIGQYPLANASGKKGDNLKDDLYGLPTHIGIKTVADNSSYKSVQFSMPAGGKCLPYMQIPPSSGKYLIGDYYTNWSMYDAHKFDITNTPLDRVNFLIYGFFGLNPKTNEALDLDPYADFGKKDKKAQLSPMLYFQLQRLYDKSMRKPELNVSLSFGGWGTVMMVNGGVTPSHNYGSGDLSQLFQYGLATDIKSAADSMVSAMLRAGYNGIDIDWEWTAPVETQDAYLKGASLCKISESGKTCDPKAVTQQQAQGYENLMTDIKADFTQLKGEDSSQTQKYILSTALMAGTGPNGLSAFLNFKDANQKNPLTQALAQADVINLMTYDMHGAFDAPAAGATATTSNVTALQSPLNAVTGQQSIGASINYLKTKFGVKSTQILMGVPAYARVVKTVGTTPSNSSDGLGLTLATMDQQAMGVYDYGEFSGDVFTQDYLGASTDQAAAKNTITPGIRGSGTFDYRCIVDTSQCVQTTQTQEMPEKIFATGDYHNSSDAQVPYAYSAANHVFMSYDDEKSTNAKMKYAQTQKLGGAFIWEADGDIPENAADFKNKSIVSAMYETLFPSVK